MVDVAGIDALKTTCYVIFTKYNEMIHLLNQDYTFEMHINLHNVQICKEIVHVMDRVSHNYTTMVIWSYKLQTRNCLMFVLG